MSYLFLQINSDFVEPVDEEEEFDGDSVRCSWVVLDDEDEVTSHGNSTLKTLQEDLDESVESVSFDETVLVLSDAMALFVQVEVPGRTGSQMAKALPFTVEGYISSNIEDMHIARGPVRRNVPVDCVAIEKTQLKQIIDSLSESGIHPTHCTTIGLQIPSEESSIGVIANQDSAWVRTEDQLALMDKEVVADALSVITQISEDEEIRVHIKHFEGSRELASSVDHSPFAEVEHIEEPMLVHLGRQFDPDVGINLLQGEFATQDQMAINSKSWIRNGLIVFVGTLIYIGTLIGEGIWADSRAQALESEATELYRDIYGQTPGSGGPARRMRANLAAGSGEAGSFQKLLGEFANVVNNTFSSLSVQSVTFRESSKSLQTDLEIASFEALDTFEKSLERGSVTVDINTAEQSSFGVRANLTLTLQ